MLRTLLAVTLFFVLAATAHSQSLLDVPSLADFVLQGPGGRVVTWAAMSPGQRETVRGIRKSWWTAARSLGLAMKKADLTLLALSPRTGAPAVMAGPGSHGPTPPQARPTVAEHQREVEAEIHQAEDAQKEAMARSQSGITAAMRAAREAIQKAEATLDPVPDEGPPPPQEER